MHQGFENAVGGTGAQKTCDCCSLLGMHKGVRDFDAEPTLHETRYFLTDQISELVQPGGIWNEGNAHKMQTCGCDACGARYAELVA